MEGPPDTTDIIHGRYRTVGLLGAGGMGRVYEAVDERLDRLVAIKVLHVVDPTSAARLRAEAMVLARLHHPNLVTVYDTGDDGGRPFVVTELVRGRTLRRRMDQGPMAPDELARIGSQVASALACAHDHGVVHRDITPGNVLLADPAGDARLIDFGIAVSQDAVALTATGLVIGTPAYLSPEQVEGSAATTPSDVYSLGIVLIEALTGRKVFPGTPTESAAARLVADAPVPATVSPGWRSLLEAMTRRDPALRPTALQVAERLGSMSGEVTARPVPALTAPPGPMDRTTLAMRALGSTRTQRASGARVVPVAAAPRREPPTVASGRWPIFVAALALVAGLAVMAVFAQRAGEGPSSTPTAVEPVGATTTPTTTGAVTPVTAAPTTATSSTTAPSTPASSNGNAGKPGGGGQGKPDGAGKAKADGRG